MILLITQNKNFYEAKEEKRRGAERSMTEVCFNFDTREDHAEETTKLRARNVRNVTKCMAGVQTTLYIRDLFQLRVARLKFNTETCPVHVNCCTLSEVSISHTGT
jgi:hypothetical protein